jgi:hypothetical protein
MKRETRKHYIEILPAACLPQRDAWRKMARSLPAGGCLLVANPNDKGQTRVMRALAESFRRKGRRVVVWFLDGSPPV